MWFSKVQTICLLFFFCVAPILGDNCSSEVKYVIRNLNTSLVLDSSGTIPAMQQFDGYESQLWTLEWGSKPGTFYIVNSDSKNVLDVDAATLSKVTTSAEDSSLYQEWFLNSDGHIANAQLVKFLTTGSRNLGAGLGLVTTYQTPAFEIFVLQEIDEFVKFFHE